MDNSNKEVVDIISDDTGDSVSDTINECDCRDTIYFEIREGLQDYAEGLQGTIESIAGLIENDTSELAKKIKREIGYSGCYCFRCKKTPNISD